eukprot:GHVO01005212.1.p1 GENE.GHVO01005212.1~~GHVO01005212.1.p1  ORF type:complete len:115 (-),score=3.42 GHVO01005212.1:204-548(-)
MFVHGGMSKNGAVLNDFHFHEVAGGAVRTSRVPRQADEPFPRYAHAIEAARINGRSLLFLYGGYSPVKRLCDDLWIFDYGKGLNVIDSCIQCQALSSLPTSKGSTGALESPKVF